MSGARVLDESALPSKVDVLIVGTGPVGATYARTISDLVPRASILMVDAGPQITEIPGQHVRNITDGAKRARAIQLSEGPERDPTREHPVAHFDSIGAAPTPAPGTFFVDPAGFEAGRPMPAAALSRNVGGMGSHWAAAAPTPSLEERAAFISPEQWAHMITRARSLLAVDDAPTTNTVEWGECLKRLGSEFDHRLPKDNSVRNMPIAGHRRGDASIYWTGPDVVLGDLAHTARETFAISPDSIVRQLRVDGDRVGGVVIQHLPSAVTRRIDARLVVVAADSLHTPQLLWESGVRPEALGRHLNDHTMVGALVTPDYLGTPDDPGLLFDNTRSLNNVTDAPSSGMGWIPFSKDGHPIHGQFGQSVIKRPGEPRGVGMVIFGYMLAKEGRYEDRVRFSEERTDAYGMPELSFDYGYTERDLELQAFAREQLERIGGALGASDLRISRSEDGMSLHYLGTTRMGAVDDGTSVCDAHSRVWGYENLYIGGNGVISTPLSCNPTLTSVSLAVHGAERAARSLV